MNANNDDWNRHWESYSSAADNNPAQKFRFDRIMELLMEDGHSPSQVVDVGCGNGGLLAAARVLLPSVPVLGIEPSRTGAQYSARRLGAESVVCCDITKQSLPSSRVAEGAVFVCTEVLEHVDDPLELVKAVREIAMTPESRLIVSVPGGYRSAYDRHIGHREHFTRRRLKDLLKEAGYSNIHVYRAGFPFFNIYKLSVILLGKKLIENPDKYASAASGPSRLGKVAHKLMMMSFKDSPFGWQLFAVATR